jgi:hypothetical protein
MANVEQLTRQMQYAQVSEACEKLGHMLNDFPKAQNGRSAATCKNCCGVIAIRVRKIRLPGGKVNLQMKAEGSLLVQQCGPVATLEGKSNG